MEAHIKVQECHLTHTIVLSLQFNRKLHKSGLEGREGKGRRE